MLSEMVNGLKPGTMAQISLNFQHCGIPQHWLETTDSSLKGEEKLPLDSSASVLIALDYCLQFVTLSDQYSSKSIPAF